MKNLTNTGDAGDSEMARKNEEIRQIAKDFFEEIWNKGDESAIDKFLFPIFIFVSMM